MKRISAFVETACSTGVRCWPVAFGWLAVTVAFVPVLSGQSIDSPVSNWLPDQTGYEKIAQPFFQSYCIQCHADDGEGEFKIARDLTNQFAKPQTKAKWSEVVNVLNGHEMPPEDANQPKSEEVARLVDWITEQMISAEAHDRTNAIVVRRLNRNEYKNTIRDLIGIDYGVSHFPQDSSSGGFDNNGSALSFSPMLLELYYDSARKILDKSLVTGSQPEKIKWRFEHEEGDGDRHRIELGQQRPIVHGAKNEKSGQFTVMRRDNWDLKPDVRDFRVPHPGKYQIRIRAASKIPSREAVVESARKYLAQRRDEQIKKRPKNAKYENERFEEDLRHFQTDSMYDYGPPRLNVIVNLGGQPFKFEAFDVAAPLDQPAVYTLEKEFTTEKAGVKLEYAYDIPRVLENHGFQGRDDFARPEAWIDWTELEGPIYESWPPASHQNIIPEPIPTDTSAWRAFARTVIERFANRAFRRPVTQAEVDEKLVLFDRAIESRTKPATDGAQSTQSNESLFIEAIKLPLTAILVSPEFLFIAEPNKLASNASAPREIDSFELASRLSYFLWSSMPDAELMQLAREGQLNRSETLDSQVQRMLADPKSEAFIKNFAGQWLGLRDVGANPPTPDYYPRYDRHLEISLVGESEAFFREILEHDLSCANFIHSDFVTINERLSRFYDIAGVKGDHFRRVPVVPESHRGGLLTQASMLTITSNGTRTSPVKRGTWVLNNVLGMDPGLPVANVGEIAPKVPGLDKATVRQRLEIHRQLPQCARCHNKIDPLGFALENFDASGRWREKEGFGYKGRIGRNDPVVDASSKLPDGTEIVGVDGLAKSLLERKELFYNCLAEKMFTYALGRELAIVDRPHVDAAVEQMNQNGETLRSLIQFIVKSEPFLTK